MTELTSESNRPQIVCFQFNIYGPTKICISKDCDCEGHHNIDETNSDNEGEVTGP